MSRDSWRRRPHDGLDLCWRSHFLEACARLFDGIRNLESDALRGRLASEADELLSLAAMRWDAVDDEHRTRLWEALVEVSSHWLERLEASSSSSHTRAALREARRLGLLDDQELSEAIDLETDELERLGYDFVADDLAYDAARERR
tara:strand:+ start:830 stop:1267 length:438 start_codon:yes stop_codon:yes gene_type:complete